jgi:hypothetical protein
MLAILPLMLVLAAQPTPDDDGPLATAPRETPAVTAIPGLEDPILNPTPDVAAAPLEADVDEALTEPVDQAATPAHQSAAPEDDPEVRPAVAPSQEPTAPVNLSFQVEPKTKVDGETLQVVLGQRALFRLDDKGWPVLLGVEKGQLAAAHPAGKVDERFGPPPEGQIAVALDGSAEVRATILKVWNETDRAVDYRAIALIFSGGKVTPSPAPVCAAPPRSVRIETWRRPIVAVGLGRFKESVTTRDCP